MIQVMWSVISANDNTVYLNIDVINNSEENMTREMDGGHLQEIEESTKPPSSKRSTKYSLYQFTVWRDEHENVCNFHTITEEKLNEWLRKFEVEVKDDKQDTLYFLCVLI